MSADKSQPPSWVFDYQDDDGSWHARHAVDMGTRLGQFDTREALAGHMWRLDGAIMADRGKTTTSHHERLRSIIERALIAAETCANSGTTSSMLCAREALSLARDAQELYAASGPSEKDTDPRQPPEDDVSYTEMRDKWARDLEQQQAQAAELNDTLRAEPVSTEWSKLRPGDVIRKPGGGAMLWTVESIGLDTGILGATSCDGLSMRLRMAPHELWLLVSRLETKGGAS